MKAKMLGLIASVGAVGSMAVNAQDTTYDYQGNPIDITVVGPCLCQIGTVSAQITLAAPLGDNFSNDSVTPVSFMLISGGVADAFNVRPTDAYFLLYGPTTFDFSTNAAGAIDGWNIQTSFNNGSADFAELFTIGSTNVGGVGGDSVSEFHPATNPFDENISGQGMNTSPGYWSEEGSTASAPEIDPSSALAGITLLLGGLAVARGRRLSVGEPCTQGAVR